MPELLCKLDGDFSVNTLGDSALALTSKSSKVERALEMLFHAFLANFNIILGNLFF